MLRVYVFVIVGISLPWMATLARGRIGPCRSNRSHRPCESRLQISYLTTVCCFLRTLRRSRSRPPSSPHRVRLQDSTAATSDAGGMATSSRRLLEWMCLLLGVVGWAPAWGRASGASSGAAGPRAAPFRAFSRERPSWGPAVRDDVFRGPVVGRVSLRPTLLPLDT